MRLTLRKRIRLLTRRYSLRDAHGLPFCDEADTAVEDADAAVSRASCAVAGVTVNAKATEITATAIRLICLLLT